MKRMGEPSHLKAGIFQGPPESRQRDIDRIIFRSKMRGWITPEEGHEKAVPFSADERSRA